jgi:hypothetical protein
MRGVAAVCAQQRMGGSAQGWLRVVHELARLAEALTRSAEARDVASYHAQMAGVAAAELRAAHENLAEHRPAHLSSQGGREAYDPASTDAAGRPTRGRTSPFSGPDLGLDPTIQQPPSPDLGL